MIALGFIDEQNMCISDCFKVFDVGFKRHEINDFVSNTRPKLLNFTLGEFNTQTQNWRQIIVGQQRNIRIIKTTTSGTINVQSLIKLFHRLVINMCISICEDTLGMKVIIMDDEVSKYRQLVDIVPCVFIHLKP